MLQYMIAKLRKDVGMSQAQLAKELNISASTIGMYEQGRRVPGIDMLVTMSRIFDVSLDYLITGEEYTPSSSGRKERTFREDCPCSTCYWKNCK